MAQCRETIETRIDATPAKREPSLKRGRKAAAAAAAGGRTGRVINFLRRKRDARRKNRPPEADERVPRPPAGPVAKLEERAVKRKKKSEYIITVHVRRTAVLRRRFYVAEYAPRANESAAITAREYGNTFASGRFPIFMPGIHEASFSS